MDIIGHRGAAGLAPENSIEAIRKAIELNVDMIEIDVRLQNGVPVLSHDTVVQGQSYCPLKQALQHIDGKVPINIEIKEVGAVMKVMKQTSAYDGEILFSSFKFAALRKILSIDPDANIAVLEKWSGTRGIAEAALIGAKRLHMNERWLWSNFVSSAATQGFEIYAYTVNDIERAKELKKWGVKGIFTDYPDRFKN